MCRTKNPSERKVIDDLEADGYEVFKRGWPDLVAVKGDTIRFIEVKRLRTKSGALSTSTMKSHQTKMAEILKRCGITVEMVRGV